MQLIEPLMGGVTGAEGGTAEIWNRADTARAPYYLDFEGTKVIYSGLDIELDAYGSAEIYTGLSALVRVRSQGGSIVREFTILGVAHADELDTASFTDDTVGEALDTWEPSAGEPDFEVTLNGAPTDLEFVSETTFAQMQTVCAVKSFGAIGDGVADDSVAIGKAIAFASRGGGTVLFNAGTYLISSTIVVPGTVTLQGTGPGGTLIIQSSHTARVFSVQSATATAYISGMTIRYASTAGDFSQYGVNILSGSRVKFSNMSFGTSSIPFINAIAVGSGLLDTASEVAIYDSSIYAVTSAYRDFRQDARPDCIPKLTRCAIQMIGAVAVGSLSPYVNTDYAVFLSCSFTGAAGGLATDDSQGVYVGTSTFQAAAPSVVVTGCSFANPTSSDVCRAFEFVNLASGAEYREDRNAFGGAVRLIKEHTLSSSNSLRELGSISPRVLRATANSGTAATLTKAALTAALTRSNTSAFTPVCSAISLGTVARVFVQNSGGGTLTQGLQTSGTSALLGVDDFPNGTAGVSMGNGTARLWEYVAYPGTVSGSSRVRNAPIVDGAQVGPLT